MLGIAGLLIKLAQDRPTRLGDEVRDTLRKARESPDKHRFGVLAERTEQWKI
jgi:hypothetical protein